MNSITLNLKFPRIEVVDALLGFAIISIMLLHNVKHFEYYYLPENFPTWLVAVDKIVMDSLFSFLVVNPMLFLHYFLVLVFIFKMIIRR